MLPVRNLVLWISNSCLLAWGGRRWLLAFLIGVISAASLAPLNWSFVLLLTLPMLVWLMDGAIGNPSDQTARAGVGFAVGWWFGFGYFLAGLWWIGSAFLVEADKFAWLIPLAIVAMPVGLALFHGLLMAIAARLWSESWERILILAAALSFSDYLRGHVLTGFPWNSFGQTLGGSLVLQQLVSIVGMYGLGLLVVLVAAMPAILLDVMPARKKIQILGLAAVLVLVCSAFGTVRLHAVSMPEDAKTDLRIVQPAISQSEKWRPENRDKILQKYLNLSELPLGGNARIDHERILIWPESAVPFLLAEAPQALHRIMQAVSEKTTFVTGAIRADRTGVESIYFNSLYAFAGSGMLLDVYDKIHLVPFGEYLPAYSILKNLGLEKLVALPGRFVSGYRRKLLELPSGVSFWPLICYEAIFPNYAASTDKRPDFLLNVTNDAWFGLTSGPYQHLAQARLRAIEQGLPLVRAANTGISTVIDAKGIIRQQLKLEQVGVIDTTLPGKMPQTIYAKLGDWPFLIFGILIWAYAFGRRLFLNNRNASF